MLAKLDLYDSDVIFVVPPTVVVSCSLPWLMLIKPKSCYFRGKHTGVSHLFSSRFDLYFHVPVFVSRVISSLQRQLVMTDFTPEFRQKLQDFYRRFLFPVELKNLRNRCVPVHAGCCNSFSFSVIQVTD